MRSPNNVHLITLSYNYLLVITKIPVDICIDFSKVIDLILKDISISEYGMPINKSTNTFYYKCSVQSLSKPPSTKIYSFT